MTEVQFLGPSSCWGWRWLWGSIMGVCCASCGLYHSARWRRFGASSCGGGGGRGGRERGGDEGEVPNLEGFLKTIVAVFIQPHHDCLYSPAEVEV